jgi:hypothetical protein
MCFIAGILIFIGLFITFSHANAVVKREIAKQSRRSLTSLLLIVCNLLGCILFIYYMFQDQKLYLRYLFVYLLYCWDVGQRYRRSIVLHNMSVYSSLFLYLCIVYFDDASSSPECIMSNGRMMLNMELERVWKEMVMAWFHVLSQNLSVGTEVNIEKPKQG